MLYEGKERYTEETDIYIRGLFVPRHKGWGGDCEAAWGALFSASLARNSAGGEAHDVIASSTWDTAARPGLNI